GPRPGALRPHDGQGPGDPLNAIAGALPFPAGLGPGRARFVRGSAIMTGQPGPRGCGRGQRCDAVVLGMESMGMFDLTAVQKSLAEFGLDGWLLYDFRASNVLARRVLGLDQKPAGTRRFFYFIPASGTPRKLVHRIETAALDDLPGEKSVYLPWQELEAGVADMLGGCRRVAMEYAPRVSNPYVSKVDAGVIELVRSTGVEIISSGDLLQQFEATWDDDQWRMHLEAERLTTAAFDLAWSFIADRIRGGQTVRETEVQAAILEHFHRNGMTTYSPPIVGVGPHSGDPHYEPIAGQDGVIGQDDFVLIDLWAKLDRPRSVYSDLTRVGYVGGAVPERHQQGLAVVAQARDAA